MMAHLNASARTSSGSSLMPRLSAAAILSCVSVACGGGGPTAPSRGAVVTFQVVDETFRVHLLDERQMNAAHQAVNGGRARIPNGRIVAGAGVNAQSIAFFRTQGSDVSAE